MNNDILLSTKFKSIGEDATVSMPSQIKALFGINPQIDVRLIDYDYIGDAKEMMITPPLQRNYIRQILMLITYWLRIPMNLKTVYW